MINQGTIFEESTVFIKFIFVGVFFAILYYFLNIIKRILIKGSFSDSFKEKFSKKEYKYIKNPLTYKGTKRKIILDKVLEIVLDIIYFIIITPMMAIFLFGYNNGQVRWYIYGATLLGFFVYKLIFGKLSNLIIEYTIYYFLIILNFGGFLVLKPINVMIHKLKCKIKHRVQKRKNQKSRVVVYSYGKSRR
ncbi:MAG: spore cortex biosynthesis protein YabQ [Clostridia bacterium]|nr:spore cortex biosynthesis protein YabQ [Clostridia bacterium]